MTTDTELRELIASAHLPWTSEGIERELDDGDHAYDVDGPLGGWIAHVDTLADAQLIAAAVNALPGLLDRLERAEAEVQRLRDTVRGHESMRWPEEAHRLAGEEPTPRQPAKPAPIPAEYAAAKAALAGRATETEESQ